jgi:hypothetical protein
MLKKNSVKQIVSYVALILLGMLISTSVISSRATVQSASVAESPDSNADVAVASQPAAPASPDAVWTLCTPVNVAAYTSRIHVKCAAAAPGGIWYFAASTAHAAHAARLLSVLSTAHAAGRTLDILYEPSDTSGASIGCDPSDCRLMLAAAFLQ